MRTFSAVVLSFFAATTVFAEKNANIDTKLASIGSLAVSESFDSKLGKPLVIAKGEWKTVDGILVGKELAADEHAAVLSYQKKKQLN